MLEHIAVRNIALITSLDVDFDAGLLVLTGETGAGKSLLIDAMKLALGGRADRDLIRHGADKASVEAVFSIAGERQVKKMLEEAGLLGEDDEPLILSRELSANGKNICRIGGVMVPLALLGKVASLLVDLCGQHDHQTLLHPSAHLHFLDAYGAAECADALQATKSAHQAWRMARSKMEQTMGHEQERARELDLLRYQVREIEEAGLQAQEEEQLLAQRTLMQNSERINRALHEAYAALYESESGSPALETVSAAMDSFEGIASFDGAFAELHQRISDAYYQLDDIVGELRALRGAYHFDPSEQDEIESRLELIHQLERKYGRTVDDVLAYAREASEKIERMASHEEDEAYWREQEQKLRQVYVEAATVLSQKRRAVAVRFSAAVARELRELSMDKARFDVQFADIPDDEKGASAYTAHGFDTVSFMLAPNAGEPMRPVATAASGGELSRTMLALKNVAAASDELSCVIFDEIDAGIGGHTAQVVGEKLFGIARDRQVICVTHLPQIAAMADVQYRITKYESDGKTHTTLEKLSGEARVTELARMTDGEAESKLSREHAAEMLARAVAKKA